MPALSWQHYTHYFMRTLQWLYSKEKAWSIKCRIRYDPTSDFRLLLFLPQHELLNNQCIIQGLPLWLSWWRICLQCWRPGLGRSPGEGKGYPPQYSGLENSAQLSNFHFHFPLLCGNFAVWCSPTFSPLLLLCLLLVSNPKNHCQDWCHKSLILCFLLDTLWCQVKFIS